MNRNSGGGGGPLNITKWFHISGTVEGVMSSAFAYNSKLKEVFDFFSVNSKVERKERYNRRKFMYYNVEDTKH